VFAVPRSIAMSFEMTPNRDGNIQGLGGLTGGNRTATRDSQSTWGAIAAAFPNAAANLSIARRRLP
jgi:hypothetical protein